MTVTLGKRIIAPAKPGLAAATRTLGNGGNGGGGGCEDKRPLHVKARFQE